MSSENLAVEHFCKKSSMNLLFNYTIIIITGIGSWIINDVFIMCNCISCFHSVKFIYETLWFDWLPKHHATWLVACKMVKSANEPSYSSGFCSMKCQGVFYFPLDGMLVPRRVTPSIKFAGMHLCTWVESVLPKNRTHTTRKSHGSNPEHYPRGHRTSHDRLHVLHCKYPVSKLSISIAHLSLKAILAYLPYGP